MCRAASVTINMRLFHPVCPLVVCPLAFTRPPRCEIRDCAVTVAILSNYFQITTRRITKILPRNANVMNQIITSSAARANKLHKYVLFSELKICWQMKLTIVWYNKKVIHLFIMIRMQYRSYIPIEYNPL